MRRPFLSACLLLLGCAEPDPGAAPVSEPDPAASLEPPDAPQEERRVAPGSGLDLLWVIDASCHQRENRDLAAAMGPVLEALEAAHVPLRFGAILDSSTEGDLEVVEGEQVWSSAETIGAAMEALAESRTSGSVIDARFRALAGALLPRSEASEQLGGSRPLHVLMSSREEDESPGSATPGELLELIDGVPRQIRVHTTGWFRVGLPDVRSLSQLSEATGGVSLAGPAEDFAEELGLALQPRARFFLQDIPVPETLEVIVGSEPAHLLGEAPPSAESLPFEYDPDAVAVEFPRAQPAAGQEVVIRYERAEERPGSEAP